MIDINVLGCCVSREMLNYSTKFIVPRGVYTPFVTMLEPKVPISIESIEASVDNNFYRKMVLLECKKSIFEYIAEDPGDYILLDFAEVAINFYCVEFPDGIVRLPSTPHYKSLLDHCGLKFTKDNYTSCSIKEIVAKVFEELLKIYPKDRIILNQSTFSEKYIIQNESGLKIESYKEHYRLSTPVLSRVRDFEKEAMKYLDDSNIILSPLPFSISNGNHKYGNSPVHYIDCQYKYLAKRLEYYLGLSSEQELFNALTNYCNTMNKLVYEFETNK